MTAATAAGLREATAEELGLPACYAATELFVNADPVDTDVELARTMARLEAGLGRRPTVVFTRLAGRPGQRVLANPYPRPVLLAALGTDEERVLPEMAARLAAATPGWVRAAPPEAWEPVPDLGGLPVVRHRPGDAGPYVTAGVAVTTRPDGGGLNLGIYRVQITGPAEGRIFMDPRTDGHRNLAAWLERGEAMPITVFLGADPVFSLVGASRLPAEGDDYDIAARLLAGTVAVTGEVPAPVSATHVITGRVLRRTAEEGPFGEFKGYYVDARRSNVFEPDRIARVPGAPYPTIVAGGESGLTLMSLQNEYLMFAHLAEAGFAVRSVRYPLTARGEFLTLIESDDAGRELLATAMAFDRRTKMTICGPELGQVWQSLATHGFVTAVEPYYRKGRVEGERVGIVLTIPPTGRPVEY